MKYVCNWKSFKPVFMISLWGLKRGVFICIVNTAEIVDNNKF